VVHCASERQAHEVLAALAKRMDEVGLRLHPDKTKVVYCQDGKRGGSYVNTSFTFLGFTFRARPALGKGGEKFSSFTPAISQDALKAKGCVIGRWRMHLRTGLGWTNSRR
jgi:hypothetical protein